LGVRTLRILGITGAFLGLVLCATLPAKASTLEYAFSFTGPTFSGSGDVFVNSITDAITTITGSIVGPSSGTSGSIAEIQVANGGLYTASNGLEWAYDNVFYKSGVPFDNLGALFSFGANNIGNIYSVGTQLYLSVNEPGGAYDPGEQIQLKISQTPLPAALPMFLTALGGLWFVLRRRNKNAAGSDLELEHFAAT
jgi:hypothetical protein